MICVGIDVSKRKSTVCFMAPGDKIIRRPFDVRRFISASSARSYCVFSQRLVGLFSFLYGFPFYPFPSLFLYIGFPPLPSFY